MLLLLPLLLLLLLGPRMNRRLRFRANADACCVEVSVHNTLSGDIFYRELTDKDVDEHDFYVGALPPSLKSLEGFKHLLCDALPVAKAYPTACRRAPRNGRHHDCGWP